MDQDSLSALRMRIGDDHLGKRLRAQVDLTVQILGRGGHMHLENMPLFEKTVNLVLRATGLYEQGHRNALDIKVRENPVSVRNLPEALDGFRILQLSDLHLDGHPGFGQVISDTLSVWRHKNAPPFDVCVLTGDFRFLNNGRYDQLAAELTTLLPALACHGGIYGILGNHDFVEMVPILEEAGVHMLLNESAMISTNRPPLWLVGLEDAHLYGLHDFDKALTGVPQDATRVLLVHSPEVIPEAAGRNLDLYLTGHTHGGQICLPGGFAPMPNARCARRYTAGAWNFDGMAGYTSYGTGASGVFVRYFCPPEIVIHTLKR